MAKVTKGMSIDEVRQIWLPLAEAKAQAIMDSYCERRQYSGGREGLGIYSLSKERAAREKVRLAVRLLKQAGLDVSFASINKVTGQSRSTISNYWAPPQEPSDPRPPEVRGEPVIIKFPRQGTEG